MVKYAIENTRFPICMLQEIQELMIDFCIRANLALPHKAIVAYIMNRVGGHEKLTLLNHY